jgi:hypothetical protein
MFHCPVCEKTTIPVWYAFVPQFMLKPHICGSCGTAVVQKRWWGELIAQVPPVVTIYKVLQAEAIPESFIWYSLGLSFVAGTSLWVHTIRFKEAPKPERFEPHTSKLKWRQ